MSCFNSSDVLEADDLSSKSLEDYITVNFTQDCIPAVVENGSEDSRKFILSILLPIVMAFCLCSFVLSLCVVCCAPFVKRPMSATIRLSLSLSAANAAFAFIVFVGTLVHSYLPYVCGLHLHICLQLTIEAIRMGIILVQVYHLVVVALVHYFGTRRPLAYASTLTPRCLKLIISVLWIVPILGMFVTFSSIPGQGYQSEGCKNNHFRLNGMAFRYIWSGLFFGPTILLVFVYSHIFYILRSRGKNIVSIDQRKHMNKNAKTVKTTAMIVGLFIIGWCPAVAAFLLICDDCVMQVTDVRVSIAIFTTTYCLFILKVLADSFIYVLRLPEIREAMKILKEYSLNKMGIQTSTGFRGRRRFNSKYSSTFRSTFISSHSSIKDRSFKYQCAANRENSKILVELYPLNGQAATEPKIESI